VALVTGIRVRFLCLAILLALGACHDVDLSLGNKIVLKRETDGSVSDGPDALSPSGECVATSTFNPLKVGNTWTYRVTGSVGLPWRKVVKAAASEMVGGRGPNATILAIRVDTLKRAGDRVMHWDGMENMPEGRLWVRYREQAFDRGRQDLEVEDWWSPHRLRIDETPEHMTAGAAWEETFTEFKDEVGVSLRAAETKIQWQVLGANETVNVDPPSGPPKVYKNCLRVRHSSADGTRWKIFWFCCGIGKVKEIGGQFEELIDHQVTWP
jgi:hypothetical protein